MNLFSKSKKIKNTVNNGSLNPTAESFLEPIYLNEKMVLNCAAYLFKGIALESEETKSKVLATGGSAKLGMQFLESFLPISAEGNIERSTRSETKSARRYTVGGLHMVVLEELRKRNQIARLELAQINSEKRPYVEISAVLKPIDFLTIVETIKMIIPLTFEFLKTFGDKFSAEVFTDVVKKELPKYQEAVSSILGQFESDYRKSNQVEMVMVDPDSYRQIGIADIDVTDYDPSEVEARLTGGRFYILGKITNSVGDESSLSLVQRTFLSTVMDLVQKAVNLNTDSTKINQYKAGVESLRPIITEFCQLEIKGPAVRIMPMSICI